MSFAGRLADIAHKTVVTTCLGLFTFQAYQLGTQMMIGTDEEKSIRDAFYHDPRLPPSTTPTSPNREAAGDRTGKMAGASVVRW